MRVFSSWPWVLGSHLHKHPWLRVSWFVGRSINIKCVWIHAKGRCHLIVYQQQLNDILMSLWKWQFMSPYLSMDIYIPRPVLLMIFSSSIYPQTESQMLLVIFLRQWSRFSFEIIFPQSFTHWLCKPMSKYKGDSQLKYILCPSVFLFLKDEHYNSPHWCFPFSRTGTELLRPKLKMKTIYYQKLIDSVREKTSPFATQRVESLILVPVKLLLPT